MIRLKYATLLPLLLLSFLGLSAQGSDCASATALPVNASCVNTAFSISNGNSGVGTASCVSNINDDAWYSFTATGVLTGVGISGASENIGIVVYSGTCAGLTEIACDDQGGPVAYASVATTPGTTYYVRIIRTSTGGGSTTGDICVVSVACTQSTVLNEPFNGPAPLTGAITTNIYGSGLSNHNAGYILSGSYFGWFNIINGVGPVDVYDRSMTGLCPGAPVTCTFWTRESYGGTNVTFSLIDDNGLVLASQTMTLTGVYQQITLTCTATTPGMRFLLHFNGVGGNGFDIVMEDLLITQCCPNVILPVELTAFNLECRDNVREFSWYTDYEVNTAYYSIERSADGQGFEELAQIPAAGNSQEERSYYFTDPEENLSPLAYRLSLTDLEGVLHYLAVESVDCSPGSMDIVVYPNPAEDVVHIEGPAGEWGRSDILDARGRSVRDHAEILHQTERSLSLDISRLPEGIYFFHSLKGRATITKF